MSKSQSTSKARQPKLRASCDGCFLAKVKCSKERPICSRCLTTGAECGYSPSCRTGKSKTMSSPIDQISTNSPLENVYEDSAITYTALNKELAFNGDSIPYGAHSSWISMQGHPDPGLHRRSISTSTVPSLIRDTSTTPESIGGGSSTDAFDSQYSFNSNMRPPNGFHSARSKSVADVSVFTPLDPWIEGQRNDMFVFEQTSGMGPFEKELYSPTSNTQFMSSPQNGHPSCNCFNASLQALQALHNHTAPTITAPSFDVVLTINRSAIDACNTMLNCSKCIGGINSNTSTMHLATIIGKVMSFYRAASQNYFGFTSQNTYQPQALPLTIGTYKISEEDGRWLEMEILLRELRKLEEVLGKFQDVCQEVEAEMEGGMQSAVITYLKQSLGVTFEVLNMRRQSARV